MENEKSNIPMLPASDHDLLIVLHTNLNRALKDIERLGDGISTRLSDLEHTKLDKKDFDAVQIINKETNADYERRLRRMERWGFSAIGALAIIELVAKASLK